MFYSCRSSNVFRDGHPVTTFEGDSSFFENENNPILYYKDLDGVITLSRDLKPHQKLSIKINTATLFQFSSGYKKQIVYPGESVMLGIDKNYELTISNEGSDQRNREFLFSTIFQNLDQTIWPQFPGRTTDYSIDSILSFEKKINSEMPAYLLKSEWLFDSLSRVYDVSNTFRQAYNTIIETSKKNILFGLYQTYKIELRKSNLYLQKQRELLPYFNNISNKEFVNLGGSFFIESIAEGLFTKKINFIDTEKDLNDAMDSVIGNFHSLSRDFLLTKIMYNGIKNGIPVSKKSTKKYSFNCRDKGYRLIGKKLIREKLKYRLKAKGKKDNRLISLSNSKIFTIDEIINQHKGAVILIDLWASWCGPCIEGMPSLKKMEQEISSDKFKIIYLSLDKEWIKWRNKSEDLEITPTNSYLFENFDKQSFLKTHNVQEIPRYILIDQSSNIITSTAPAPNDQALKTLIEKYLIR